MDFLCDGMIMMMIVALSPAYVVIVCIIFVVFENVVSKVFLFAPRQSRVQALDGLLHF